MRDTSIVERHLQQEAAAVERFTARLRLIAMAVAGPLAVPLMIVGGFPRDFVVAAVAFTALALVIAGTIDQAVRRGAYRRWFPYVTVAVDITVITAAALGSPGGITVTLRSPFGVAPYFLIIALAGLRHSVRLSLFAGALAAVAYAALLGVVAFTDPSLIVLTGGFAGPEGPGVSAGQMPLIVSMLVLAGVAAAVDAARTRRLVARALDTVTFLFADLRDYTPFLESHGDTAGAQLVSEYRRIVRAEIARTGGREVKTEGDSFLVAFGSARQALECAIGILREAVGARRRDLPLDIGIGINAGEPVVQEGDYVGLAVNVAARLGQQARAGELLVSELVRGLTRSSSALAMERRDGVVLKGVSDPPAVYAVSWEGATAV